MSTEFSAPAEEDERPSPPPYKYAQLSPEGHEFRIVHILPGTWDEDVKCELHVVSSDRPTPSEEDLSWDTLLDVPHADAAKTKEKEPGKYQTLSYVWGDPGIKRPILVDGCTFEVTLNLWSALRRLRNRPGEGEGLGVRKMWIDALCINQNDNEERTRQVTMMGTTYARCSEVVIWLGDGVECVAGSRSVAEETRGQEDERTVEEGTALFQSNLEKEVYPLKLEKDSQDLAHSSVGNAFAVLYKLARVTHLPDLKMFVEVDKRGPKRDLHRDYRQSLRALHKIMKRPYWNRIWVVQEAILPPNATVVCGSISVPWQMIVDAGYAFNRHSVKCCYMEWANLTWRTVFVDFSFIVRVVNLARERRRKGSTVTLYWLLKQYFDREATDPRDKAYGVLGLVNSWGNEEPLVPDYDISARELYEELTMRIVHETGSLEILMGQTLHHTGGDDDDNEEGMPSWVADWGRTPDAREWDWEQGPWTMSEYYSASPRKPFVAECLPNSLLHVRGVRVDPIISVSSLMTVENQSILFSSLEDVLSLYPSPKEATSPYIAGGDVENAYFCTLRGDIMYNQDLEFPHRYTRTKPEDRRGYELYRNGFTHSDVGEEGDIEAFRLFWKSAVEAVRNRRFFVTKSGYMGLGPKGTKAGDEVVVLEGARVPFVVRGANDGTSSVDRERADKARLKAEVENSSKQLSSIHSWQAVEKPKAEEEQSEEEIESRNEGTRTKRLFKHFQANLPLRKGSKGYEPSKSGSSESAKQAQASVGEKENDEEEEEKGKALRPVFRLVGDAYVHGIMDGEVFGVHRVDVGNEKGGVKENDTEMESGDIYLC